LIPIHKLILAFSVFLREKVAMAAKRGRQLGSLLAFSAIARSTSDAKVARCLASRANNSCLFGSVASPANQSAVLGVQSKPLKLRFRIFHGPNPTNT
jgi:hypothetical protein